MASQQGIMARSVAASFLFNSRLSIEPDKEANHER